METPTHRGLRRAAVGLLLNSGCAAAATEVRCPIERYRVDAAGYLDPLPKSAGRGSRAGPDRRTPRSLDESRQAPRTPTLLERGERARTIIIECKQSRADFLRDRADAERLMDERAHLTAVKNALEVRILKVCEPELRTSGTSLFAELESWNFGESRLSSYRQVLDELRSLDRRLYGSSKFWRLAQYRLADALYVAAPLGMLRAHELPEGWGLLEISRAGITEGEWALSTPAPALAGNPSHRQRLLRNIAAALSVRVSRGMAAAEVRPTRAAADRENPGTARW